MPSPTAERGVSPTLPDWARELVTLYESGASSQFVLYGNVSDRMLLPSPQGPVLGSLSDYLVTGLLARFDVVLSYDLGSGIRAEKGGDIFSQWPLLKEMQPPAGPRLAVEFITQYLRYCANLARLGQKPLHVAVIIRSAHLAAPASPSPGYDLAALALLMRDWSTDTIFVGHPIASFLIAENLSDLSAILTGNPRAAQVKLPLPGSAQVRAVLEVLRPAYPKVFVGWENQLDRVADQFAGATLASIESLVKSRQYQQSPLTAADLVKVKKDLVEKDCGGLIEFVESTRTLDDLFGLEKPKAWLRQDLKLWQQGDLAAIPMGYLICGPVGTGKTFLVECLAGEAGVPVVKLKNFRDKWVGSTEGNLERIFRLLQALGRCFVFIDEADQSLGKRDSGSSDSNLSGRIYSMMAQEMSNTRNRGRIVWVLATSRPDLVEVDLKRPGRVDVKIPIFPTATPRESFDLVRNLCSRRKLVLGEPSAEVLARMPLWLTPGAAEALALKVYRVSKTASITADAALAEAIADYQNPVPRDILEFQVRLAAREASDLDFVPPAFRSFLQPSP